MNSQKGVILYICLSEKWGTIERAVIRDALTAKEEGFEPLVYNLRDSLLDIKVRQEGLETYYHTGRVHTNFVGWRKLRNLPRILRTKNIKVVHCYDLNFIWPMSFFLRGIPHIPLFLTQAKEIRKNYNTVLHGLLSSRIDQIFIPFSPLEKNVIGQLGVPSRKVVSLGYGVKIAGKVDRSEVEKIRASWQEGDNVEEDEIRSVGVYVPMHLKGIKGLKSTIYATMGLNQKLKLRNKVRLVLYTERNWTQTLIYPDLIRFVKDLGVENLVLFYSGSDILTFQHAVDLWLGSVTEEQLDDYSIQAVIQGVPIVVPRSTSSMEMLRLFGPIGETFKRDDSRQLRDQCSKILLEKKHYSRLLKNTGPKLEAAFGYENYHQTLIHYYLHSLEVRRRYSRQRELSF